MSASPLIQQCRIRHYWEIRKVVINGHKSAGHTKSPDGGNGKICLGRDSHWAVLLVMAALRSRCGRHIFAPWFLLSIFFLVYSQPSQIECLPYLHIWCGLSANIGCRSETCCARLAENTGHKKSQKSSSVHHRTTLSDYIFATKAHIDNRNLLSSNISSTCPPQYGELRPKRLKSFRMFAAPQVISTGFASWQHGSLVVGVSQTLRR